MSECMLLHGCVWHVCVCVHARTCVMIYVCVWVCWCMCVCWCAVHVCVCVCVQVCPNACVLVHVAMLVCVELRACVFGAWAWLNPSDRLRRFTFSFTIHLVAAVNNRCSAGHHGDYTHKNTQTYTRYGHRTCRVAPHATAYQAGSAIPATKNTL